MRNLEINFRQWGLQSESLPTSEIHSVLVNTVVQQRIGKPENHIQRLLENPRALIKNTTKIRNLIDVFSGNVEFHCFEKACQFPKGPVAYFLNLLELKQPELMSLEVINESRSNHAVRLISCINKNWPEYAERRGLPVLRERSDIHPLFQLEGEKFTLTQQEFDQVKPEMIKGRSGTEALLGADFFLPPKVNVSENMLWNEEQLSAVNSIIPQLNKHITVLVYDYFLDLYQQAVINYPRSIRGTGN